MAPPARVRPGMIPFWMFNDAATVAERLEYLRACRRGGIMALAMHPRAGNLVPYGSAEWFETIRVLVEEARRLGMNLWLYDEDPFPSGAAGGMVMAERPDLLGMALGFHEKPEALKPGDLWFVGEKRVLWAGFVPVAKPLPARELPLAAGTIRNDWFGGPWDSRYYYYDTPTFPCERGQAVRQRFALRVPVIPAGFTLAALTVERPGEDGSWGGLPDLLNYDAFPCFARLSLDVYARVVGRHFGRTIPGVFTDEAKPHGYVPITGDLFPAFRRANGYDLRPRLHQLFGEALSDEYVKTRLDYRRWMAERFLDAFVRPYRRWCDRHNLLLVGHFSPEDDPIWETPCLGAVRPIMKTMSLPGTDIIVPLAGDAKAPCLNLGSLRVGSIRSQAGLRYGVSESLALGGWHVTSEECRRTLAWQRVLGINRFFPHGFFNSTEGISLVEAPPDYGPNSSIFPGISAVNDWLKECDALADGESEFAPVAIVDNILSYWDWAPGPANPRHEAMRRNLWNTVLVCLQAHAGVHMVDENELAGGRVVNRQLVVGKRRYRWVLVPDSERLPLATVRRLAQAWKAGVPVWWCGGGPKEVVDERFRLRKAGALPGAFLNASAPSLGWCRRHLPPLAGLEGEGLEDVYIRRFAGERGGQFLLAVNLSDRPRSVTLKAEGASGWLPVRVDGDAEAGPAGTCWRVPARCCGLFRLGRLPAVRKAAAAPRPRATGSARTFQRLGPNTLRLDRPWVTLAAGSKPKQLKFPQPYWQLADDYAASRTFGTFLGELPVESRMPKRARLAYRFDFRVRGRAGAWRLVMDPRFARGRFTVIVNGKPLGGVREWPLATARPARLPLSGLRQGLNRLEFRFEAGSAMDGLLTWAYLEGDFDADVSGRRPVLSAPKGRDPVKGWPAAGLPHYMGLGRYTWSETLNADEAARFRTLEFERIVDSAALRVNGRRLGRRAWAPWRWPLRGLRAGVNRFELTVSSTAGNKLALEWPNQPQGWLGRAWLR